ncbi:MAG: VRR-NUC domain-containing protein [bacterium]|nr:VRR-NUC domain-containing protein [bacterium]
MREKDIEQYLVKRVKERGGRAYKFVSPGNSGVPDRIVVMPNGVIVFVELKATGEKTRPLQNAQIAKLRKLGQKVQVLDTKDGVDRFLEEVKTA